MTDDVLCIRISPNGELLDSIPVLPAQPGPTPHFTHEDMTSIVLCIGSSPDAKLGQANPSRKHVRPCATDT